MPAHPYISVTIVLSPEQDLWLKEQALIRKRGRGGKGRADSSEIAREIIQAAMENYAAKSETRR